MISAKSESRTTERQQRQLVVFLHAFPCDATMWEPVAEAVRELGYDTFAPTLPGFGSTDAQPDVRSMSAYANGIITQLSREWPNHTWVLVGCSMGGYLIFELFRQAAQNIAGIVLCDSRAEPDTDESRLKRKAQKERVLAEGVEFLVESLPAALISEYTHRNFPDVAAHLQRMIRRASPEGIANALDALANRSDSRNLLPQIPVATLVLVGEADAVTPPATAKDMHAAINGSTYAEIPHAGHLTPIEAPQKVAHHLCAYLSALAKSLD